MAPYPRSVPSSTAAAHRTVPYARSVPHTPRTLSQYRTSHRKCVAAYAIFVPHFAHLRCQGVGWRVEENLEHSAEHPTRNQHFLKAEAAKSEGKEEGR
eukprot:2293608-Rhodomonas_salina.1